MRKQNPNLKYAFLILVITAAGLFLSAQKASSGPASTNYSTLITLNAAGTAMSSSATYSLQSLAGQSIIGPTAQGDAKNMRYGFLPLLETTQAPTQAYEIYDIQAFSRSTEESLLPTTWQKVNDPYFVWKTRMLDPSIVILGYSTALDAQPDEVIDTTEAYYDGFASPLIADGKHTFYVKAATTGGVWGEAAAFEFWVDTHEPKAENLDPASGSLIKDNTPAISLSLSDVHSGVDLDTIKLYIDDQQLSFNYQEGVLTCAITTALPDGSRTCRIKATDFAGNLLNMVWGFTVDSISPVGSILINGGEDTTNYAKVRLNLAADDETTQVTEMIISNDGIFDSESWEPFQSLRTDWILDEPQKIGLKTVYCMFKDEAGNISSVYQDDIRLLSPAIDTVITQGPYSPTKDTTAQFSYQSTFEDVVFSYKLDGGEWSDWSASNSADYSELPVGNYIFSVKSAKDLDASGTITGEEEDPLPAQWVWVITSEEKPDEGEKVLYWKTE